MHFDPVFIVFVLIVLVVVLSIISRQVRVARSGNSARSGSGAKPKLSHSQISLLVGLAIVLISGIVMSIFSNAWPGMYFLVLGLLVVYFALAGLIADMASSKGRNWASFFWLSSLFSPLIMWIIAASISPQTDVGSVMPTSGSQPHHPDLADQIKKLGDLHKDGLITKSEYEAKKRELLDRM